MGVKIGGKGKREGGKEGRRRTCAGGGDKVGITVDDDGCTESVDVLTRCVGMDPVRAPLTGDVHRDFVSVRLTGRNSTKILN